jgi:Na+-transporting NADH:ubiquinone oxidoreductase subunit F
MAVEVPDEVFGVRHWTCRVRSSESVGTLIKEIVLELPETEAVEFRAGSFVQIESPPFELSFADLDIGSEYRDEWDRLDLWRYRAASARPTARAYSMANYADEKGIIILNVRAAIPPPGSPDDVPAGIVSSYLFSLKPGDLVRVSGPFGHFFAHETDREMVFVGGGVGMAPMRAHILDQLKRVGSQRKISFWYGARNLRELFYREEFDRLQEENPNFRWVVALSDPRPEDGWRGKVGFVHDVLCDSYLEDHPAPEECEYYLCGPPMMMRAVMRMLDNLGVEAENIRFDDFGA